MKKFFCIYLLIFITNVFLYGQGGESTTLVGRWAAGPPYAFAVENNIIYSASGGILLILDISDPSNPQLLGQIPTNGIISDVSKLGNYIYLAEEDCGLKIIDVINPADPIQISEILLPGYVNKLVARDQTLYVAEGKYNEGQWIGGLRTVDISDQSNPQPLGFYDSPGESHYISLVDNYIYIDNYFVEILIIDISDLSNPTLAGSVNTRFGNSFLSDNLLYIASSYPDGEGLKIFDVTNPIYPSIISFTVLPGGVKDVIISGNYAFITNGDYWDGNTWREGIIRVFDITDSALPIEIGLYESSGDVSSISNSSNTLIISEGTYSHSFSRNEDGSGLRFLDVTNPFLPQPISYYATPGWGESVMVRDNYAFILTRFGGMSIVDLEDIVNPTQIGYYNSPGSPMQVALQNNYAYLADGNRGLRVIDICDLTNPIEVGNYETGNFFSKISVIGDYAYVLSGGLLILDISNPTQIVEVSFFELYFSSLSLLVRGNYAYLGEGVTNHWGTSGWIKIIDVTNPANPIQIGEYFAGGGSYEWVFYPTDLAIGENFLYVANEVGSLRVFDISDPTNPIVISDTPTFAKDLEVEGIFAYLTHFNGDIKIFDVSDPFNPEEICLFNRQFYVTDIDVKNGRIYASAFDLGMMILQNEITTNSDEEILIIPEAFALNQNYPNPFNPSTRISYSLPFDVYVTLKIYDILGNEVLTLVNENELAGNYEIDFSGKGLSSGVYFYVLRYREQSLIKKMLLLK